MSGSFSCKCRYTVEIINTMWEQVFNVCCGIELCYWQLTGTIYVMIYMNSKRMVKHFGEPKTQQATSPLGLGMKLQRFDIKPDTDS